MCRVCGGGTVCHFLFTRVDFHTDLHFLFELLYFDRTVKTHKQSVPALWVPLVHSLINHFRQKKDTHKNKTRHTRPANEDERNTFSLETQTNRETLTVTVRVECVSSTQPPHKSNTNLAI